MAKLDKPVIICDVSLPGVILDTNNDHSTSVGSIAGNPTLIKGAGEGSGVRKGKLNKKASKLVVFGVTHKILIRCCNIKT